MLTAHVVCKLVAKRVIARGARVTGDGKHVVAMRSYPGHSAKVGTSCMYKAEA
jgi:hypothetical protein